MLILQAIDTVPELSQVLRNVSSALSQWLWICPVNGVFSVLKQV